MGNEKGAKLEIGGRRLVLKSPAPVNPIGSRYWKGGVKNE
jgi:hypothetical protein